MKPRFATFIVLAISSVLVGACATGLFSSGDVQASARALVVQPDGKLVLAGPAGVGTRVAFALVRYLPDGSLDPTFGSGGRVLTPFKDSPSYARFLAGAYARGLAIQPDGKLVAAGVATIGGFAGVGFRLHYALARYRADGSLDPAFGADGTLTNHIEQTTYNVPTFALQPPWPSVSSPTASWSPQEPKKSATGVHSLWPAISPTAAWTPRSVPAGRRLPTFTARHRDEQLHVVAPARTQNG